MKVKLTSVMGKFNHPNHNGRIYDSKMMEEAIKKFNEGGLKICELNPGYERFFEHSVSNAVGNIKDVWVENGEMVGTVNLLDTPKGEIAKEIMGSTEGHKLKLFPRMTGNVVPIYDEDGNLKHDENNNPICEITNVDIESIDIIFEGD